MGQKKHDDPSVVTASHHDVLASVLGRYVLSVLLKLRHLHLHHYMSQMIAHMHFVAFILLLLSMRQ
jgi:hypothetical protein